VKDALIEVVVCAEEEAEAAKSDGTVGGGVIDTETPFDVTGQAFMVTIPVYVVLIVGFTVCGFDEPTVVDPFDHEKADGVGAVLPFIKNLGRLLELSKVDVPDAVAPVKELRLTAVSLSFLYETLD
jgi:hypothetical protein